MDDPHHPQRFVVLRHEVGPDLGRTDKTHFDWMFESEGILRTWSTDPIDDLRITIDVSATPLDDHRMEYLQFEGEISGGRGHVTRIAEGTYTLTTDSSDQFGAAISLFRRDSNQRFTTNLTFYRSLPVEGKLAVWRLSLDRGR